MAAKGKAEPVEAWVAVAPRSIVPEQTRVEGLPLVGRDAEAELLRGALDRSRGEPSTQLVSVIGEPGIGKTRLVEELFGYVEQVPEMITWRRGRSLSYGEGVAFWALGEMVKARPGSSNPTAASRGGEACRGGDAVVLDERDREWVTRHLRPLVGVEARRRRSGRVARWRRSRRGGGSSRRSPRTARRCWCSRISTGPTTRCWTSSTCWQTAPARCRC